MTDDVGNKQLSYVTSEDICGSFEGDTLLAVQAPQGTQLEVPIPALTPASKRVYQIHLKSSEGQIYVLLVNKETADSEPMVVQVPLPREVSEAMRETETAEQQQKTTTEVEAKPKEEQPHQIRRSGRGKTKATSPPLEPSAKRSKLDGGALSDKEREDEAAAKEVEGILGGPLPSEIPGLEDLISTESKSRPAFSLNCTFNFNS